jgi:hypothetical protein
VTIKDSTVLRVSLALQIALLAFVAKGAWFAAEISFKVDALWSDRFPTMAASGHKEK